MVKLTVNGKPVVVDVDDDTPVLWVLRDQLGLTGTKFGCGIAQCGACTVHVDGEARRSCVMPIGEMAGRSITTIEDRRNPTLNVLREAWAELDVAQCGYCQAGQLMSALALVEANPAPTDDDIDSAMSANLCRCGTYPRIRLAIHHVTGKKR